MLCVVEAEKNPQKNLFVYNLHDSSIIESASEITHPLINTCDFRRVFIAPLKNQKKLHMYGIDFMVLFKTRIPNKEHYENR